MAKKHEAKNTVSIKLIGAVFTNPRIDNSIDVTMKHNTLIMIIFFLPYISSNKPVNIYETKTKAEINANKLCGARV